MHGGIASTPAVGGEADARFAMAAVLIARFGGAATQVVERQIEAATGDDRAVWEAIRTRLPAAAARP